MNPVICSGLVQKEYKKENKFKESRLKTSTLSNGHWEIGLSTTPKVLMHVLIPIFINLESGQISFLA
jgi:hypothetical protein